MLVVNHAAPGVATGAPASAIQPMETASDDVSNVMAVDIPGLPEVNGCGDFGEYVFGFFNVLGHAHISTGW